MRNTGLLLQLTDTTTPQKKMNFVEATVGVETILRHCRRHHHNINLLHHHRHYDTQMIAIDVEEAAVLVEVVADITLKRMKWRIWRDVFPS